jgi:hypothetical protein
MRAMRISNLKSCITVSLKSAADADRLVTKCAEKMQGWEFGTCRNE